MVVAYISPKALEIVGDDEMEEDKEDKFEESESDNKAVILSKYEVARFSLELIHSHC